jgi:hypothetical protein
VQRHRVPVLQYEEAGAYERGGAQEYPEDNPTLAFLRHFAVEGTPHIRPAAVGYLRF